MLLKTSQGTFIVKFRYDTVTTSRRLKSPKYKLSQPPYLQVPRTTCIIKDADTGNELANEHVQLFSQDQFRRAVGRKKALEKALNAAGFNRAVRSEIWEQYWLSLHPHSTPAV